MIALVTTHSSKLSSSPLGSASLVKIATPLLFTQRIEEDTWLDYLVLDKQTVGKIIYNLQYIFEIYLVGVFVINDVCDQCELIPILSPPPTEHNDRHFGYQVIRCNFVNEKTCNLIKTSLKFVLNGPIYLSISKLERLYG